LYVGITLCVALTGGLEDAIDAHEEVVDAFGDAVDGVEDVVEEAEEAEEVKDAVDVVDVAICLAIKKLGLGEGLSAIEVVDGATGGIVVLRSSLVSEVVVVVIDD
tara:strand:+ start:166 stop:480 length:315 start_codon:yes stop_codon:yes gene_type:complete